MPADAVSLEALGWDDGWASELERLDDDKLIPGRIAAQHRGVYVLWTETGEVRAEVSGRLRYDLAPTHGLPAVGDWVAARPTPHGGRSRPGNARSRLHAICVTQGACAVG